MRKKLIDLMQNHIKINNDILKTCRSIYKEYPELKDKLKETAELTKADTELEKKDIQELKQRSDR